MAKKVTTGSKAAKESVKKNVAGKTVRKGTSKKGKTVKFTEEEKAAVEDTIKVVSMINTSLVQGLHETKKTERVLAALCLSVKNFVCTLADMTGTDKAEAIKAFVIMLAQTPNAPTSELVKAIEGEV